MIFIDVTKYREFYLGYFISEYDLRSSRETSGLRRESMRNLAGADEPDGPAASLCTVIYSSDLTTAS